jgi:hypothetical protein
VKQTKIIKEKGGSKKAKEGVNLIKVHIEISQ